MAGPPVARVEVEWTAGTWTDITAWWDAKRPVTITTGRSDTTEHVEPGRLSGMWLDNTDGRFTVGNLASPYAPNVGSGRRVRLSVQDPTTASWIPRFTGRIDALPITWADNGSTCWVCLSAADLLNDWAVADMPADYMWRALDASGGADLLGYWECVTLDAAGQIPARKGGGPLRPVGVAPTSLTGEGLPGDPRPPLQFVRGTTDAYYTGACPTPASSWGLSAWIRVDSEVSASQWPLVVQGSTGRKVGLRLKTDGLYLSTVTAGGTATDRCGPVKDLSDSSWHLVQMRAWEGDVGGSLVLLTVDDADPVTADGTPRADMLVTGETRTLTIGDGYSGQIAHIGLWGLTTLSWQVAAPGAGLAVAKPSGRLAEIASMAGLAAPTVVGDERIALASSTPSGKAIDLARQVEDTDGGILWCDGDGAVTYLTGPERTAAPTVAIVTHPDEVDDLQVAADRVGLANEVTVTNTQPLSRWRPDATTESVIVSDPDSLANVGRRPVTLDTIWLSDSTIDGHVIALQAVGLTPGADPGYLHTRAARMLNVREVPRIPIITVDVLAQSAAQQSAWLAAQVWDLIALLGLPSAGSLPANWLGRLEGWEETVGVDEWRMSVNCSYAGTRLGSTNYALLDSMRLG